MIKAIVMDLDDTLLKYDKTISEFTIGALKKCAANGIKLVFATGRGASSNELVPANFFDARIMYNGAIAEIDSTLVFSQLIASQTYAPFLGEMSRLNLRAAAEIGGIHYANFDVSAMWERKFVIADFAKLKEDAEKLYVILNGSEDAEKIAENLPFGLYPHFTKDGLALIMNSKATKLNALSAVLRQLNIDFKDTIAFGDDVNDKEILKKCGIGVAMANALEGVKMIADDVCGDCDSDGVANYLVSHVL
jgi:Predicted hydrolases of the HAD superfamily